MDSSKEIVMFSHPGCEGCHDLKAQPHIQEALRTGQFQGVPFSEVDVTTDPRAEELLPALEEGEVHMPHIELREPDPKGGMRKCVLDADRLFRGDAVPLTCEVPPQAPPS